MSDNLFDDLRNSYTRYNQYVDVVSCWESFLEAEFGSNEAFSFIRFPKEYHTVDGQTYIPDFSVKINEDYGILFEIKRTVGGGEQGYSDTYSQLEKYLKDISHISDGLSFPSNKDVVFLVKDNESRRIARKVQEELRDRDVDNDRLIILEYSADTIDSLFYYSFKKVFTDLSPDFSDRELEENPLKIAFGKENDYMGVKSYIKHFWPYRLKCPIMNDSPPPVYLSCLLWMDHFYGLLRDDQKEHIRRSSGYQDIEIVFSQLYEKVNEDYPVISDDLKAALEFLKDGNLAEESDKDGIDYVVKYHRMKSEREILSPQKKENEREKIKELSEKFFLHYLKHREKKKPKEKKKTNKQIKQARLDIEK